MYVTSKKHLEQNGLLNKESDFLFYKYPVQLCNESKLALNGYYISKLLQHLQHNNTVHEHNGVLFHRDPAQLDSEIMFALNAYYINRCSSILSKTAR